MTIELQPDLENTIQQRMATGAFRDVNDLLLHALASLGPIENAYETTADLTEGQSLLAVFDRTRGVLTEDEADTLFARDRSLPRTVDLS